MIEQKVNCKNMFSLQIHEQNLKKHLPKERSRCSIVNLTLGIRDGHELVYSCFKAAYYHIENAFAMLMLPEEWKKKKAIPLNFGPHYRFYAWASFSPCWPRSPSANDMVCIYIILRLSKLWALLFEQQKGTFRERLVIISWKFGYTYLQGYKLIVFGIIDKISWLFCCLCVRSTCTFHKSTKFIDFQIWLGGVKLGDPQRCHDADLEVYNPKERTSYQSSLKFWGSYLDYMKILN